MSVLKTQPRRPHNNILDSSVGFSLNPIDVTFFVVGSRDAMGKLTCEKLQYVNEIMCFIGYYSSSQIQPQPSCDILCTLVWAESSFGLKFWSFESVQPPQNRLSEKMVHRHFLTARLCATKFSNFLGKVTSYGQRRGYVMECNIVRYF